MRFLKASSHQSVTMMHQMKRLGHVLDCSY